MNTFEELQDMAKRISESRELPRISRFFLPKYFENGQPKNAEFMAIGLENGSTGISFVSITPEQSGYYESLGEKDYVGRDPADVACERGGCDIDAMISLAAINAVCQYTMGDSGFSYDFTTDTLGLLDISADDHVGMVGFFPPLVRVAADAGGSLTIIEKKEIPFKGHPNARITMDPSELEKCNKVLCTSTVVLNESIDEILSYCRNAIKLSIVGPSAGYFPDPLFDRGVDVVGATTVTDQKGFFDAISKGQRWGKTTKKYAITKEGYAGIGQILHP